jgi:FKBP-type peptidyl-prolyl cis-trans isomerase
MRIAMLTAFTLTCLMTVGALAAPKSAHVAKYDLTAVSNARFLADHARQKGVIVLPDGLQYRVIHKGHGKSIIGADDLVTVQYKGWLINGTVFDQTKPGTPVQFPAGRLIPGWVEALKHMRAGDEWELVIPARLGYGAEGAGAAIPPGQTLVFDMKLLAVTRSPL